MQSPLQIDTEKEISELLLEQQKLELVYGMASYALASNDPSVMAKTILDINAQMGFELVTAKDLDLESLDGLESVGCDLEALSELPGKIWKVLTQVARAILDFFRRLLGMSEKTAEQATNEVKTFVGNLDEWIDKSDAAMTKYEVKSGATVEQSVIEQLKESKEYIIVDASNRAVAGKMIRRDLATVIYTGKMRDMPNRMTHPKLALKLLTDTNEVYKSILNGLSADESHVVVEQILSVNNQESMLKLINATPKLNDQLVEDFNRMVSSLRSLGSEQQGAFSYSGWSTNFKLSKVKYCSRINYVQTVAQPITNVPRRNKMADIDFNFLKGLEDELVETSSTLGKLRQKLEDTDKLLEKLSDRNSAKLSEAYKIVSEMSLDETSEQYRAVMLEMVKGVSTRFLVPSNAYQRILVKDYDSMGKDIINGFKVYNAALRFVGERPDRADD